MSYPNRSGRLIPPLRAAMFSPTSRPRRPACARAHTNVRPRPELEVRALIDRHGKLKGRTHASMGLSSTCVFPGSLRGEADAADPRFTATVPPALAGDGAVPPPPPPPRAPAARHTRAWAFGWLGHPYPSHPPTPVHPHIVPMLNRLRRAQHVPVGQTRRSGVCAARLDVCPAPLIRRLPRSTFDTFASAIMFGCGCAKCSARWVRNRICGAGKTAC